MKKIITALILILLLFTTGCTKEKFYLDSKFYKESKYIDLTKAEYNSLTAENYIIYTYNSYCNFKIPCDNIFKETMDKYNLSFYSMPYSDLKETELYNTVKFAPSVIIIKNKKVVAYLKADSDDDYDKYQNSESFTNWLESYIYLEPQST